MSSWYTTKDSSTWCEATDHFAWIPSSPVSDIKSNVPLKNVKPSKETGDLRSTKVSLDLNYSPPQTESTNFFELPSNSAQNQNAWDAYIITNEEHHASLASLSQFSDQEFSQASLADWNQTLTDSVDDALPTTPKKPEKVVFSKLKRNVDIEAELTKQSLYKTELCQSWIETGACRYGPKCQFAHGKEELRPVIRHPKYKTEICKTFNTTGHCPYGKRCRFVHQIFELRSGQQYADPLEEQNQTFDDDLKDKMQALSLGLAPDPVFPAPEAIPSDQVKKGSRLPFFQKLRKQKW